MSYTSQHFCSIGGELRKVEDFAAGVINKETTTFVTMLFVAIRMQKTSLYQRKIIVRRNTVAWVGIICFENKFFCDRCGAMLSGVFMVAFERRHAAHFNRDTSHVGALFFATMNGPECNKLSPSLFNHCFFLIKVCTN
jgi:hypothetical protein